MVEGDLSEMEESPAQLAAAGAVTALTLLVGFGLLAAGVSYFWVAFVVGFAGLLPMSLGAVQLYERRKDEAGTTTDSDDAIDELRRRYARGELTAAEFEQRVEKLIETEGESPGRRTRERREREHE